MVGFPPKKNSTLTASNSRGVELGEINVRSRVFGLWVIRCVCMLFVQKMFGVIVVNLVL